MADPYFTTAAKGCVIQATSHQPGYYKLHGLETSGPIFVQAVSTAKQDIVAAVSGFNNNHRFFVFGKGFGDIVVSLEAHLGNAAQINAEQRVNTFFERFRSAQTYRPVTVTSLGGSSYSFFLVGCRATGFDANFNIITFQLVGKLIE